MDKHHKVLISLALCHGYLCEEDGTTILDDARRQSADPHQLELLLSVKRSTRLHGAGILR